MWFKKMQKKKFQFLLVCVMLCFTSVIFAACIGFSVEISAFTDNYVSNEGCPKIEMVCMEDFDDAFFEEYPKLLEKTDRIEKCDVTYFNNNFFFGEKQVKTYLNFAYHVDDYHNFMHRLDLLEGEGVTPKVGEIWINSVTADSYGIQVGDILHLGSKDGRAFHVSGIVATPICPSPYIGILPYYINADTAKDLEGQSVQGYSFYEKEAISVEDYRNLLPVDMNLNAMSMVDADVINTAISYLANMFGGVGIIAAIIIFVVSLIIIRFIIISTLAREYVEIGTYKALGFTENQITGFYLKCFLASGMIGILFGVLLSFPLEKYLCNLVVRHIGEFELTYLSFVSATSILILMVVLLVCGVLLSLHKTRKITPVEAFMVGSASSRKKTAKSLIPNAFSPFCVAVNDIVRKKRASLFTIAILTISFYMTVFFLNINSSLQHMDEKTGEWFTFPQYTGLIQTVGRNEEVDKVLDDLSIIDYYIYGNADIDLAGIESDYDVDMSDLYVQIFSDCSEEALGLPLIDGRHPKAKDEILMSYDMALELHLHIGDWYSLRNDVYSNDYLITGLYSSMFNGGRSIIMQGNEFANFEKPDQYNMIQVFAKEGIQYEEMEKAIKDRIPDVNIAKTEAFLESANASTNSISKPLTSLFAIIFVIFSLMNIINLLIMNNIENRRQYGILKALGFTNGYICFKNILQIGLLTIIAAVFASIMQMTLSKRIFFSVIHVNGLIATPFTDRMIIIALFGVIMFTTAMFTIPLNRIAPTELMEE